MLIDAFTVFGSWPGLPNELPFESLRKGLDQHKLTHACTLSTQGIFFDAATGNAITLDASKQDKRLIPIGVADPRHKGAEQVQFCKQHGFKMMALFPVTQGWSFDNIAARFVLNAISEAKLPVLIEANGEGMASAILEAAHGMTLSIILHDVSLHNLTEAMSVVRMKSEPALIQALKAPIGEVLPTLLGGLDIYLTTRLLCGGDTIEYLAGSIGADRLIFASRFPISCFSSSYLTAQYANLVDTQRKAIMGGNIGKLVGV